MTFQEALAAAFGSQARLAVWLPLLGYLAWQVLSRRFGVTSPRARFLGLLALTLLPALVFIWPFATTLGRGVLMSHADVSRFFDLPQRFANGRASWWISLVYLWPYFIIPLGMIGAVFVGAVEYLWARVRLLFLRKSSQPGVTILEAPGLGAFTFGLLRPRVFISRAAWDGPHRDAILAHERAHARRFDPLWMFIARGIRRSTLYLPFGAAMYRDLLLESERACDAAGAEAVGRKHFAQALLDFAEAGVRQGRSRAVRAVPTALAFGPGEAALGLLAFLPIIQALATRAGGSFLARRLEALLRPARTPQHGAAFWSSFGLIYAALVFLH